jgi:hypothetical protein
MISSSTERGYIASSIIGLLVCISLFRLLYETPGNGEADEIQLALPITITRLKSASSIVSLEGSFSNVDIYNWNTIGGTSMVDVNRASLAAWSDNVSVFNDGIALFRSN